MTSKPLLAIFGGTFDPIHRGHLAIATATRDRLGVDRLLLVPARQPPHKPERAITAWHHRFAMAVLASQELERIEASAVEGERAGRSFTVETLAHFRAEVGPEPPLLFVMGSDSLAELPLWKEHRRILELAHLVVAPRPGVEREAALAGLGPDLAGRVADARGRPGRPAGDIFWLGGPTVDLSGSELRRRLAAGASVEELVSPPVAAYISKYRIYPVRRNPESA
jgi:nicotinate-nucleotide adenylyltransferase